MAAAFLQAFVAVADHELDAAQTPPRQRAQEGRPERLGLGRPDLEAEHLATPVGVDANSDYHGNGAPNHMRSCFLI